MGLLAGFVYFGILFALIRSAVRHRGEGWRVGLVLVLMIFSMPYWIHYLLWAFDVLP